MTASLPERRAALESAHPGWEPRTLAQALDVAAARLRGPAPGTHRRAQLHLRARSASGRGAWPRTACTRGAGRRPRRAAHGQPPRARRAQVRHRPRGRGRGADQLPAAPARARATCCASPTRRCSSRWRAFATSTTWPCSTHSRRAGSAAGEARRSRGCARSSCSPRRRRPRPGARDLTTLDARRGADESELVGAASAASRTPTPTSSTPRGRAARPRA